MLCKGLGDLEKTRFRISHHEEGLYQSKNDRLRRCDVKLGAAPLDPEPTQTKRVAYFTSSICSTKKRSAVKRSVKSSLVFTLLASGGRADSGTRVRR